MKTMVVTFINGKTLIINFVKVVSSDNLVQFFSQKDIDLKSYGTTIPYSSILYMEDMSRPNEPETGVK